MIEQHYPSGNTVLRIKAQSTVKPHNDMDEQGRPLPSEDRYALKEQSGQLCLALADGAGGTGIFAGEWAQTLCEHLPEQPFESSRDLDAWLDTFWQAFYERQQKMAEGRVFTVKNKFNQEGSCATLLGLWIDRNNFDYTWAAYGDTCLLHCGAEGTLLRAQPCGHSTDFEQNPFLLNWQQTPCAPEGFHKGSGKLGHGEVLLLATDALAQGLLLSREAAEGRLPAPEGGKLKELVQAHRQAERPFFDRQNLAGALKSPEAFAQFCSAAEAKKLLKRDDYSLIALCLENL